jgi:hypothetical protein
VRLELGRGEPQVAERPRQSSARVVAKNDELPAPRGAHHLDRGRLVVVE